MSFNPIDNDPLLGGASYIVSSVDEVRGLPPEYQPLIGKSELEVLQDHAGYFARLMKGCEFAPMREWLEHVIASAGVSVTAYIDNMGQRAALVNTIGGSIRLQRFYVDESSPILLKQVFATIGSIHEMGFGAPYCLGIEEFGTTEEFDSRLLDYNSGPPAGSHVTAFYSADCGDRLLAAGDQVYHYHIGGAVHLGQSLETVLTTYFRRLFDESVEFSPEVDYQLVKKNAT